MSKFKKGAKVYIKELGKKGKINELNADGSVKSVIIDDEIVEIADKVVILWETLSWLIRFFINLFSKIG